MENAQKMHYQSIHSEYKRHYYAPTSMKYRDKFFFINNLTKTMQNLHDILKQGGVLVIVEPNERFFAEIFRKAWYKRDNYFEHKTERALNYDELSEQYWGVISL